MDRLVGQGGEGPEWGAWQSPQTPRLLRNQSNGQHGNSPGKWAKVTLLCTSGEGQRIIFIIFKIQIAKLNDGKRIRMNCVLEVFGQPCLCIYVCCVVCVVPFVCDRPAARRDRIR